MEPVKIIAVILVLAGAAVNYGATLIVKRFGLAQKMKAEEARELSGEDLEKYKHTKAVARVKIVGLLTLLPGVIMIFIAFR